MQRRTRIVLFAVPAAALGIPLVPYGRDHANPAVEREPPWPSAESRALAVAACYDCHSNETAWPWYSNIAPMSWLVQRDVTRGREELNFSRWDGDGDDAAGSIDDGEMPPRQYTWLHPDARLSAEEKQRLIAALEQMDDDDSPRGRGRGGDDD